MHNLNAHYNIYIIISGAVHCNAIIISPVALAEAVRFLAFIIVI
jgi:hypothetical protein